MSWKCSWELMPVHLIGQFQLIPCHYHDPTWCRLWVGLPLQMALASLPDLYTEHIYLQRKCQSSIQYNFFQDSNLFTVNWYDLLSFYETALETAQISLIEFPKYLVLSTPKVLMPLVFFPLLSLLCQETKPVYEIHVDLLCNGYEQILMKFKCVL